MKKIPLLASAGIFAMAAGLCVAGANFAARLVETLSREDVAQALDQAQMPWADVATDGLQVFVIGIAPNEADRFKAKSIAGQVVDATRVIDQMTVYEEVQVKPPEYRLEFLRTPSGISVFGVLPERYGSQSLLDELQKIAGPDGTVTQLLEMSSYPAPQNWARDVRLALSVLKDFSAAKITVQDQSIQGTGVAASDAAKTKLQTAWENRIPQDLGFDVAIEVPRPVVAPYVFRAVKSEQGLKLDACTVQTRDMHEQIIQRAQALQAVGAVKCQIALGRPTENWAQVVLDSMTTLQAFDQGNITITDTSVRLEVGQGTDPAAFNGQVTQLKQRLPAEYSFVSVLPKPVTSDAEATEIIITRSPEGLVVVRGAVGSQVGLDMISSLAKARFGQDGVHVSVRVRDAIDQSWTQQILSGLETIGKLNKGSVILSPDTIQISGETFNETAQSDITALFVDQLGNGQRMDMDVVYIEPPKQPEPQGTNPQECIDQIAVVLESDKINFEPGSDRVDLAGQTVLDDIADILRDCGEIPMEIAGHTDSQGREEMNLQLSQSRADAVLMELQRRRILTASFSAKGYGETTPIAPNNTQEGREANRRIEFTLISPSEPATPEPKEAGSENE